MTEQHMYMLQQQQAVAAQPSPHPRAGVYPVLGNKSINQRTPNLLQSYTLQHQLNSLHSFEKLNDKLSIELPSSKLYSELLELEQRVDKYISAQLIDIQQSLNSNATSSINNHILRVYVYNEAHNQHSEVDSTTDDTNTVNKQNGSTVSNESTDNEISDNELPGWTLRISGQLYDMNEYQQLIDNQNNPSYQHQPTSQSTNLCQYITGVTIILDKLQYVNNNIIEWKKSVNSIMSDGFEIKRSGSTDCDVTIYLALDHYPSRYKLSAALSSLLNIQCDTLSNITQLLWLYIKQKKLQSVQQPTVINTDIYLQQLFGGIPTVQFHELIRLLQPHLLPPDPIMLPYTIRTHSNNVHENVICYDIPMSTPVQLNLNALTRLQAPLPHNNTELKRMNERINDIINDVYKYNNRYEFLHEFADNPIKSINSSIMSAAHDISTVDPLIAQHEIENTSIYYSSEWVPDAIDRYLHESKDENTDMNYNDSIPLQPSHSSLLTNNQSTQSINTTHQQQLLQLQSDAELFQPTDQFNKLMKYLNPMFIPNPPHNLPPPGTHVQNNRPQSNNSNVAINTNTKHNKQHNRPQTQQPRVVQQPVIYPNQLPASQSHQSNTSYPHTSPPTQSTNSNITLDQIRILQQQQLHQQNTQNR